MKNIIMKTKGKMAATMMAATLGLTSPSLAQNVSISPTGNAPDNSAALDIRDYTDKGVLIPRIALTSNTDVTTIPSPALSLLVYNTGTGGLTPAGYYYWNGSRWVRLVTMGGSPSDAWLTLGNAGTNSGLHFIGTTDNRSLRFRTNNVHRMVIDSLGSVGIGTTSPTAKLNVVGNFDILDPGFTPSGMRTGVSADKGRVWVEYSSSMPTAPRLILSDYDDPPRILFRQAGSGSEDSPQYEAWIGMSQALSNNLAIIADSVGIGTTAPADKLEVSGGAVRFGGGNYKNGSVETGRIFIDNSQTISGFSNDAWVFEKSDANDLDPDSPIAFVTVGSDNVVKPRLVIQGNGNVGIGTTAPLTTLHTAYSSNSIQRGIISGNYINSSTGGKIFVLKGRGTVASPQPVLAGDQLGVFAFGGYFGTNVSDFTDQAAIIAITTENWNSTSRGCMLRFSTTSNGSSTSQPRVTIDQDGNVGIGTTTPGAKLQIAGGAVRLDAPQGAPYGYSIRIGSGWGGWARAYGFHSSADAELAAFGAYGSGNTLTYAFIGPGATAHNNPWMVITNTGNVGIGTTTPNQKLSVVGNICATGNITANSATCGSDIRWKKDLKPLENTLEKISQLKPVYYYWKKDEFPDKHFTDKRQIGLIAQDMQKVFPELVVEDKEGFLSVDYSRFTSVLLKAIQEQQQIIQDQQKIIQELQTENAQTKSELKALAEKMNILINTLSAEKKVGNK